MKQNNKLKSNSGGLLVFIMTIGVFGIINTEMGVVGILPLIAETFHVSVPEAGWTVSVFALVVAISAPILPLLCSGINRKKIMLLTLGVFIISNFISMFTTNFTVLLIARTFPAFFHPVYVSMAFTVAANSVNKSEASKAVSKVFIGVSAGMVLGVPVTSFIASQSSFSMAMFFFGIVNIAVFMATLLFVPSLPVKERLAYGTQIQVLNKSVVWYSIIAIVLINGAVFGFFSFMSDYLKTITLMDYSLISSILLIYGLANIIGNILAGKMLSVNARRCVTIIPFALIVMYILLFIFGKLMIITAVIVLSLGILAGIASNSMQYIITDAAPEAPDFANGLFLTSANFGTTMGTAICGMFITFLGTRFSILGTLLFLLAGIGFTFLRYRTASGGR